MKNEAKYSLYKFSSVIIKHLIDLCNVLEIILCNNKSNYNNKDVKYYLYHLISSFSDSKEKLENDNKYLRFGLEILIKNYKIKDFKEYFPEKEKEK